MVPTRGEGAGERRLILLRHAKAEPSGGVADELRPLALAGRSQCGSIGAGLVAADLLPDHVLVSSAVRTRQTWELVRSAMGGVPEPDVDVTDRVYEARTADLVSLVREIDDRVRTLLVVGHEPTMSGVAAALSGSGDDTALAQVRTGLTTGSYALLEVASWSALAPRAARLLDVVRPG
ncbi:histidine phosphatase family protein [Actinotalea sp. K2]|uniref:SixA phosphatase family protein n=1 Tax=Actinotalea sp. K2 TaxID=2939438 RepID=UPI002016EA38|nr:histidine phosphatase family protein [Actinotalea sp. K2]MCL3861945.1 histidine phosphatase family protein [Actinotalea sp. K2]